MPVRECRLNGEGVERQDVSCSDSARLRECVIPLYSRLTPVFLQLAHRPGTAVQHVRLPSPRPK